MLTDPQIQWLRQYTQDWAYDLDIAGITSFNSHFATNYTALELHQLLCEAAPVLTPQQLWDLQHILTGNYMLYPLDSAIVLAFNREFDTNYTEHSLRQLIRDSDGMPAVLQWMIQPPQPPRFHY
jgi:hypothetical protein